LYSNSSFFWTVLTEKRFMQNKWWKHIMLQK
jgi:hypothetical protein